MSKEKTSKGKMIFACGRGYSQVPQDVIDQLNIGTKLRVWSNEGKINDPKPYNKGISCLDCPCKRKAKRVQDRFFHKDDIDHKTDKAFRTPTGVSVQCAIFELVDDK